MKIRPPHILPIFTSEHLKEFWERVDKRNAGIPPRVDSAVRKVLRDVKLRGDDALLCSNKLPNSPKFQAKDLTVPPAEIRRLAADADPRLQMDLQKAIFNITAFHRRQLRQSWESEHDGVLLGQRVTAIPSVGIYVSGDKIVSPSSILMAAVPAKVAGVARIAVVCPPAGLGSNAAAALSLLGIREVYRVGGAQAIAALAYGTETIPRVDKIVGPGNFYVSAAKRFLYGTVDIDMICGPTEMMVIADENASPLCVAADLLAQAEMDPAACAICITNSRPQATLIQSEVDRQLQALPRKGIAARSLAAYGAVLIVKELAEAIGIVNEYAPRQLELQVEDPAQFASGILHAGAILLGPCTPEAVGEYFAGPSRIMPTCGTARFFSPLGVYDFQKFTNIIQYSEVRLRQSRESIERMAMAEGHSGHVHSVGIRFEKQDKDENSI